MKLYYFSSGPRERVLKALLNANFKIEQIFVTNPDVHIKIKPTIEIANEHNIDVTIIKKEDLEHFFQNLNPNIVCLSVGFACLFPIDFLAHFNLVLNVHGTLLPNYGGARTLNWVIENNEKYSGVTVHKVDQGIDTGPILLQKKFPLDPFETGASLYRKTLEFEPEVVIEALKLVRSQHYKLLPQCFNNFKKYPNRVPAHSEIDPTMPLISLFDKIRASDPEKYPAYFYYNNQKVCIKLWRPKKKNEEFDLI